ALFDEGQPDLPVRAEPVLQGRYEQQVLRRLAQRIQLLVGVGSTSGVELVGPDGQLLGPLEIFPGRRRDGEGHVETGQELLVGADEVRLGLVTCDLVAIHVAPLRRLVGDEPRLELNTVQYGVDVLSVDAHHLWQRVTDFGALELLIIDERERVETKVEFRSEEHTSELQSRENLVCRLLLEKKK